MCSAEIALKNNHYYYHSFSILVFYSGFSSWPNSFQMYIESSSVIIDYWIIDNGLLKSITHDSSADALPLQMPTPPDKASRLVHIMQSYISDIKACATDNFLKQKHNKTRSIHLT